jgi:cytoplasmic tRNA 2-thiolation protein 1
MRCPDGRAVVQRPTDGSRLCRPCFVQAFEDDVHATIVRERLFSPGDRVAVGASGGKDSTVLAHVLNVLNRRHAYGIELLLVSVDEGIAGYRDASLSAVRGHADALGLPLTIVSHESLFRGWSMDKVVQATGGRNSCSFCGVFRRQALDRGSVVAGATKIAIGHNADDVAETVLMNLLRGDIARLGRCVKAITGGDAARALAEAGAAGAAGSSNSSSPSPSSPPFVHPLSRVKPLLDVYERDIVSYAHHAKLPYHATECSYSPAAYRGFLRELLKDLESVRPTVIRDVIRAARFWAVDEAAAGGDGEEDEDDNDEGVGGAALAGVHRAAPSDALSVRSAGGGGAGGTGVAAKLTYKARVAGVCAGCGFLASGTLCQACRVLAALAAGTPRLALTRGASSSAEVAGRREGGAAGRRVGAGGRRLPVLLDVKEEEGDKKGCGGGGGCGNGGGCGGGKEGGECGGGGCG